MKVGLEFYALGCGDRMQKGQEFKHSNLNLVINKSNINCYYNYHYYTYLTITHHYFIYLILYIRIVVIIFSIEIPTQIFSKTQKQE